MSGVLLLPLPRGTSRVGFGCATCLAATLGVFAWLPHAGLARMAKHLLIGHRPDGEASALAYNFPVLQWLALYLCATVLGEWMGRSRACGGSSRGPWVLFALGVASCCCGLALRASRPVLLQRLEASRESRRTLVTWLSSSWQKLPSSPAYLLLYAGVGLCVVAACLWLSRLPLLQSPIGLLALVGRNSLVAFVRQYVVCYVVIFPLRLPYTRVWPVVFGAGLVVVVAGARAWERRGGSRWLTVGYPGLVARRTGHSFRSGPGPTARSERLRCRDRALERMATRVPGPAARLSPPA